MGPDRVPKRFTFYIRETKLADRDELHFHSPYHAIASWHMMDGGPKQVITDVLEQRHTRWTERYSHLAPEAVEEGMRQVFED